MIGNWNDQNIEITSPPVPLGHPEAFHYYQKEYGTIPSTTRSWNSYGMPWFVRCHYGKMPLTALLVAKSYVTATQEAKMLSWHKQCVVSTDALRISMWKATSEIQRSKKKGSNHCMKFFSRLIRVTYPKNLWMQRLCMQHHRIAFVGLMKPPKLLQTVRLRTNCSNFDSVVIQFYLEATKNHFKTIQKIIENR